MPAPSPAPRVHARAAAGLLLLALLLPACASAGGEPETVSRHGPLASLLPEPFGKVEFGEDPALFLAGWTGMIAGAVAAGWLYAVSGAEESGDGEAWFFLGLAAVALGAVAGGLLLALPVKGIEEFFRWLFG